MKRDTGAGFLVSYALIIMGLLLVLVSAWQTITFDPEENIIGLKHSLTLDPENGNEGYLVYVTDGCDDFNLGVSHKEMDNRYGYDVIWEKSCGDDLLILRSTPAPWIHAGSLIGEKTGDSTDEIETQLTLEGSSEFLLVDRAPLTSALDMRLFGAIILLLGVSLYILMERRKGKASNKMRAGLGFTLEEQLKGSNDLDGLNCLKKLNEHMKDNDLKVADVFRDFDLDSDGRIDHNEFKHGIRSLGIAELSTSEVKAVMNFLDTDGDGTLDYDELRAYFDSDKTWV